MRQVRPILNSNKDYSAAHALDPNRILPRAAHEALGIEIPWGDHPDDDMFVTEEVTHADR